MQRAPCGLDNGASQTLTTREEHEERLMYMAEFADAKIRAAVLHDTNAVSFLEDHLQSQGTMVKNRSLYTT